MELKWQEKNPGVCLDGCNYFKVCVHRVSDFKSILLSADNGGFVGLRSVHTHKYQCFPPEGLLYINSMHFAYFEALPKALSLALKHLEIWKINWMNASGILHEGKCQHSFLYFHTRDPRAANKPSILQKIIPNYKVTQIWEVIVVIIERNSCCLWTLNAAYQRCSGACLLVSLLSSSHELCLNDLHSKWWLKWSWAVIISLFLNGAMSTCTDNVTPVNTSGSLLRSGSFLNDPRRNTQSTFLGSNITSSSDRLWKSQKAWFSPTSCSTFPHKKKQNSALDSHPRLSSTAFQYSRETTVQMSAVHGDRPLPRPPLALRQSHLVSNTFVVLRCVSVQYS